MEKNLHEYLKEADNHITDIMNNSDKRIEFLKNEILKNNMPVVHNVGGTIRPVFSLGDLAALGWMETEYILDDDGDVEDWVRYYSGPNPVYIKTYGRDELEVLKPGESLE